MRIKFLTVFLISSLIGFSQETESQTLKEIREQQIENIKNPELWDMDRMKKDIGPLNSLLPIHDGAFPVPHYNKLGPYRGGAFISNSMARSLPEYRLMVEDKEIIFDSYFIGDSEFYREQDRNRVFFTIITVVDTLDTNDFAVGGKYFLSRNHPDYGGEGSIITKNNRIDYVSFTTPDKGSFAIVNMRLFHLEFGNIIIVTPQKDGSFRSLQIEGKRVNNEEVFEYIRNSVLKRKDVVEILTEEGVI